MPTRRRDGTKEGVQHVAMSVGDHTPSTAACVRFVCMVCGGHMAGYVPHAWAQVRTGCVRRCAWRRQPTVTHGWSTVSVQTRWGVHADQAAGVRSGGGTRRPARVKTVRTCNCASVCPRVLTRTHARAHVRAHTHTCLHCTLYCCGCSSSSGSSQATVQEVVQHALIILVRQETKL